MEKPDFYGLPYIVRCNLADNWDWDYDGWEDSREGVLARVTDCEGRCYRGDVRQLKRFYEQVTIEQILEAAKDGERSLSAQLEEIQQFIKKLE